MPTINQNYQVWNEYAWNKHGDEWHDQADFCGQPYEAWKNALIEAFMLPYITNNSHVLEIGPGHGRWTRLYIDRVEHVSLVDLSPSCLEYCKKRFNSFDHVDYFTTDGNTLSHIADHTVDFIWSYDVFVHIERNETRRYFSEFARILRDGGIAVIHHSNAEHFLFLAKVILVNMPGSLGRTMNARAFPDKMDRSFVSNNMIKNLARRSGLRPLIQTDTWGPNGEYNCRKFHDQISVLRK